MNIPPPDADEVGTATVSSKFDSAAGTMRLAALAGQSDITMFMKRPPTPGQKPSDSDKSLPVPTLPAAVLAASAAPAAPFPVFPAALLGSLALIALVLGVAIAVR